jgi:hypothetical protein
VMKDYAPREEPAEVERIHPFQRRLRDVYVRRAEALARPDPTANTRSVSQPRAATRTSLPLKKSRSSSASTDTL